MLSSRSARFQWISDGPIQRSHIYAKLALTTNLISSNVNKALQQELGNSGSTSYTTR